LLLLKEKEGLLNRKEVSMKRYETTFLIAPNLPEEETEKLIGKMSEIISKKKGKMISMDKWGKRKLAYPIEKFEEAFYVIFNYESEPDIPVELERRFKQTEAILRYLTVRELEKVRGRMKPKSPPVEEQEAEAPKEKPEEKSGEKPEEKPEEIKSEPETETEAAPEAEVVTAPEEKAPEEKKKEEGE
jgi:small subunit ribosomal protein S6